MALETGTYIDDLVATNPTSGDLKSQGDDHIRLIKATIKASFPNVGGAVGLTHGQLSGVDTPLTGTPTAPTAAPADNSTQIATTAYVDSTFVASAYPAVSGNSGKFLTNDGNITSWADAYTETESDARFAPLISPTFTGTPAGPTAAADTNTTQLATTAFVTTEANLKADLASPTFTGTPLAPTATAGTDTTQIATTAFTAAAVTTGVAGATLAWELVTAADTIAVWEGFLVDTLTGTAGITITLPAAPSVGDRIGIADAGGSFNSYNCTLGRNSLKILSLEEDLILDINKMAIGLVYSGTTYGWIAV